MIVPIHYARRRRRRSILRCQSLLGQMTVRLSHCLPHAHTIPVAVSRFSTYILLLLLSLYIGLILSLYTYEYSYRYVTRIIFAFIKSDFHSIYVCQSSRVRSLFFNTRHLRPSVQNYLFHPAYHRRHA